MIKIKYIVYTTLIIVWTLACIYGTYNNTVRHAHIVSDNGNTYTIQYDNTGDVFVYER